MNRFRKHIGLVFLSVTLVVVVGLLAYYWASPSWQAIGGIPSVEGQVRLRTEWVKALAQVILGVLVLGTLYVTWRRVRAAEQTVEVAQEGQITERFTRAVEQLGNQESMAIRLGGIYALERIAKDSPEDHRQVMEVLTAYVRENSRWEYRKKGKQPYRKVPSDIQAILTVIEPVP